MENMNGFDFERIKNEFQYWSNELKTGIPEPLKEAAQGAIGWVRRNPRTAAVIGVAAGFSVGFLGARRVSRGAALALETISGLAATAAAMRTQETRTREPKEDSGAPVPNRAPDRAPEVEPTEVISESLVVTQAGMPAAEDRPMEPADARAGTPPTLARGPRTELAGWTAPA